MSGQWNKRLRPGSLIVIQLLLSAHLQTFHASDIHTANARLHPAVTGTGHFNTHHCHNTAHSHSRAPSSYPQSGWDVGETLFLFLNKIHDIPSLHANRWLTDVLTPASMQVRLPHCYVFRMPFSCMDSFLTLSHLLGLICKPADYDWHVCVCVCFY